jgi:HEAT repeat protein
LKNIVWNSKKIEEVQEQNILKLIEIVDSDANREDKSIAYESLLKLGQDLVEPYLEKRISLLHNKNPNPLLIKLLKNINKYNDYLIYFQLWDSDFNKRAIAVEKIGERSLLHFFPEMIELIDDQDPSVRYAVCKTINKTLKENISNLDPELFQDIFFKLEERYYKENNTAIKDYIGQLITE